ncbi:nucleoside triphosphate pyrophosphohydrolase family protein [Halomonas sp. 25-S5]|uniref:nucleoside triphosphate pyrophosphohydrolase family protein n=1 Tax=Halomonas sp. 25-S5 TaxID=2994065 RepID=UPI0024685967|nr:nucleoside triphosphate pyrophosphohydrolase family protein [Halomonas sp. 25-S5]
METISASSLIKSKDKVVSLQDYERVVVETDRFLIEDIRPILMGLYGEVGSIMAASKKYRRESKAYPAYKEAVEEEFGDALWYFSALCRRMGIELAEVFETASNKAITNIMSAHDNGVSAISQFDNFEKANRLDYALIDLACVAAQLLRAEKDSFNVRRELLDFARLYLKAVQATGLSFPKVVNENIIKTLGRFAVPDNDSLPDFDIKFPEEEQLPRCFEIHITQRESGQTYLRWNDVFIGSPLTDSIRDPDGYRFHDVFHLAYAAILHWSPTFRALIKHKRKSDPVFDEAQDGGRAVVVEEGLTAWLYSYSKGLDYFEGHDSVSFDALKTIQKFVQGYEVEKCPLKLWENAILHGYSVFREVKRNNGGVVIGDRENRTITYRPIGV